MASSVLYRFKGQRLKVILFQGNSRQYIVARPAGFPYAGLIFKVMLGWFSYTMGSFG
jgi:hypothetical protein